MGAPLWGMLFFTYVILTVLGAVFDMAYSDKLTPVEQLMQFKLFSSTDVNLGFFHQNLPVPNLKMVEDVASIAVWNFSFFGNDLWGLNLVRLIVLVPLGGMLAIMFATQVGPVLISAAATAGGLLKGLFGK